MVKCLWLTSVTSRSLGLARSTVEIVIPEHKIIFSTSMFGISFWKNGERYHKSDCIFMLINYMTTCIESVKLSRDFVICQHFRLCSLFNKHVLDCFSTIT